MAGGGCFKALFLKGLCLTLFFGPFLEAKPPELNSRDACVKLEEILRTHAVYHALTRELAERTIQNFLDELDPAKTYFIEDDLKKWLSPSEEALNAVLEGVKKEKFDLFEEIYEEMIKAIGRRSLIEAVVGKKDLLLGVCYDEFKEQKWAKSEEELIERILKIRSLQADTAAKLSQGEESRKLFFQRIDKRRQNKEEEFKNQDPSMRKAQVLSYFLKAVSGALDSQTNYFTPAEASQFMIQVQQRLFGIGAQLRDDLNGFTVTRVVEGSPASVDNKIHVGDRIIAVNEEPVIGMEITEAVDLIRGPEGSIVDLTILRPQAEGIEEMEKLTIPLRRGEIVLKETRLDISEVPFGEGVIGIFRLHSFYQDPKSSSAGDIQKAIQEMQKEKKLLGVILDLRSNAGGLLPQAVSVAGLFMSKGVVVSVKDHTQNVQKLRNLEQSRVWDGPLLILTNRGSASAAEIVAQTLQEYGRAIVVGDPETYGKGTFQTFTLEAANYGRVNPKGEYKVTRGRYYTVSGKSPQLVGVQADIVVPSLFFGMEFGEKYAKFPLAADQIEPSFEDDLSDIPVFHRQQVNRLYKFNLQGIETKYQAFLPRLKKNAEERIQKSKNYQNFLSEVGKKEFSGELLAPCGLSDLQLNEAVNLMQDVLVMEN